MSLPVYCGVFLMLQYVTFQIVNYYMHLIGGRAKEGQNKVLCLPTYVAQCAEFREAHDVAKIWIPVRRKAVNNSMIPTFLHLSAYQFCVFFFLTVGFPH